MEFPIPITPIPPTQPPSKSLEELINFLSYDVTDSHELGNALNQGNRLKGLEGEARLMRGLFRDALEIFTKHIGTEDTVERERFSEASDWIFDDNKDWTFSYQGVCSLLGLHPDYPRRIIKKWIETNHPSYRYDQLATISKESSKPVSTKNGKNIGSLTIQHIKLLRAAADLKNYRYTGSTPKYVGRQFGISSNTVSVHFGNIYYNLGVHDLFSAVYSALGKGILHIEELTNGKLENFVSSISALSSNEKKVLEAYGETALRNGYTGIKPVANLLNKSEISVRLSKSKIYRKLGIRSYSQLAVASYVLITNKSKSL